MAKTILRHRQAPLPGQHEALVFKGVTTTLMNESRDIGIVQEKFIEPDDLRKHLQVGNVLRREIFLGGFRRAAHAAKVVPQLLVSRISSNQILQIGLEKILQPETTLARS